MCGNIINVKKKNISPVYINFFLKLYILYMNYITNWFLYLFTLNRSCMVVKKVHKTVHLYTKGTRLVHG